MHRPGRKRPPKKRNDSPLRIGLFTALVVMPIALAYASSFSGTFVLDVSKSILEREETRRLWPPSVAMAETNRPFGIYTFSFNDVLHGDLAAGYYAVNLASCTKRRPPSGERSS